MAQEAVWTRIRGQPWLVNALCEGACFDNKAVRDRSRVIEVDDVYAARQAGESSRGRRRIVPVDDDRVRKANRRYAEP